VSAGDKGRSERYVIMNGAKLIDGDRFLAASQAPQAGRVFPAWLMSFSLHTLILTILFLMSQVFQRGADLVENRSGGILLVQANAESTEYLSEGEMTDVSSAANSAANPPPLPTSESALDLPGVESKPAEVAGTGVDTILSASGADQFTDSTQSKSRDIGGKVTTEVFGVKGTGSEFIYLFDCSASMEGFEARPLRAAKKQLLASLDSLGPLQRFQMIFYNHQTKVFAPPGERATMFFGEEKTKRQAVRFVESIRGDGGTDHLQALKFALQLSPDVIFLLTDAEGGFTAAELSQIATWNRGGTVINAIEFGDGPKPDRGDRSLEKLAREHQGQYVYKNIATLADQIP
jgi:von Willebrand factor type A domain